jgi:hypothetical protein
MTAAPTSRSLVLRLASPAYVPAIDALHLAWALAVEA